MAKFFTMPKLGMNMTEGHIVSWLVEEGTTIKEGDPILEIETDKATNEVEAPASGIMAKILHEVGEDVPCNSVLAVILEKGENLPAEIPSMIDENVAPKADVMVRSEGNSDTNVSASVSLQGDKRIRISPSAKKLADELGVDIKSIESNGSQIRREDVQQVFDSMNASKPTRPAAVTIKPYSGIRKRTGEAMAASSTSTAQVPLFLEADAEGLINKRNELEGSIGKISYNVLLAKLAAEALIEFPYMNSQLSGDDIWEFKQVNIGIAVDSEKGLFVPVLKNTDKKSIEDLHKEFLAAAERAQNGKVSADDLEGGTFTITNLGAQEIESFVPIINYPQCAILGVGVIRSKAVVNNGKVESRNMIGLTLVFDHRIVDGVPAARFLQKIKHLIEELDK
jgi:pyruvate dehydrogenase E2 component (dihydrolipoamide acetyltransferase)